jgi:uncharacterized membrane protein
MGTLIAGLVIFLGAHSVSIVAPNLRNRMALSLGPVGWQVVYSLVSIAGFVLIVNGYAEARLDPVVVYSPPVWTRHLASLLMLPVFVLLLAAYLPGRIRTATKHPMLTATKLWAFAHLLANGMLHDLLLFGAFLAWAVADRISLKRRTPRPTPALPASKLNDAIAVAGGLALYVVFAMWLHARWIGVPPFAAGM